MIAGKCLLWLRRALATPWIVPARADGNSRRESARERCFQGTWMVTTLSLSNNDSGVRSTGAAVH
jgi:hypothetical protein